MKSLPLVVVLVLASPSALAQKGVTWKWKGDWGPATQVNCPHFCVQHPVQILRPGKTPVEDSVLLADTTGNGAVFQYVVMGRYYSWTRATGFVTFAGNSAGERQSAGRALSGSGRVLGQARNEYDAPNLVMDDAARDFLDWEARTARTSGSGTGSGTSRMTAEQNERDLAAFHAKMAVEAKRLLASAEANIGRKQYKAALQAIRVAGAIERTPAVIELEQRVLKLLEEEEANQIRMESHRIQYGYAIGRAETNIANKRYRAALEDARAAGGFMRTPAATDLEQRVLKLLEDEAAARKAIGIVDDPMTDEQFVTAPDSKALFLGNTGGKPYPNPYDTRHPDHPVEKPYAWKDATLLSKDLGQLRRAVRLARAANDGYRLLQLAKLRLDGGPAIEPLDRLLADIDRIARYNRDPWLMLHLAQLYQVACKDKQEAEYPLRHLPPHFFREAYRLAVLRGDPEPLDRLGTLQQLHSCIPEIRVVRIIRDKERLLSRQ